MTSFCNSRSSNFTVSMTAERVAECQIPCCHLGINAVPRRDSELQIPLPTSIGLVRGFLSVIIFSWSDTSCARRGLEPAKDAAPRNPPTYTRPILLVEGELRAERRPQLLQQRPTFACRPNRGDSLGLHERQPAPLGVF